MISYSWQFTNCRVIQNFGDLQNVIKMIDWKITANDGRYTVDASGTTEFGYPTPETFIEFTAITKENLITWVMDGLSVSDKKSLFDSLTIQLDKLNKPTLAVMPLSFS